MEINILQSRLCFPMAESVSQIPTDVLAVLVLLLLILFGTAYWSKRRQKNTAVSSDTSSAKPKRPWPVRALLYVFRLILFGIFAFLVIDVILTVYLSYQSVVEELKPAHHAVEIPSDLTLPIEEITFAGGDDLTMAGWYVPPQNGSVIILLHGYGDDRRGMVWHGEQLYAAGYGLLMYDERASGESEGEQRSYGWQDPADVVGALRFLQDKPEVDTDLIGIAGCSIGGQIALQGAAYNPEIQAVWADGSATIRAKDIPFRWDPIYLLVLPSNYLIDWLMTQKLDMELPPALIDIIDEIPPRPIMLVGGGQPHPIFGTEGARMERLANLVGENAEVWVIEEAFHCDGPHLIPDEYASRMVSFFDEAFAFAE